MMRPLVLTLVALTLTTPARAEVTKLVGHTAGIYSVAFSPDGKLVATAGKDRKILLWNAASGEILRTLEGHTDDIFRACFSPDGKHLASAGDQNVRLWEVATGQLIRTLNAGSVVHNVAFRPDGKHLTAGTTNGHIRTWNLADGEIVRAPKLHTDRVLGVAYSPDGHLLATSCHTGGPGSTGEIVLTEAATGREVRRITGGSGVMGIAFSPSGTTIAGGCTDKTIRLWEVCTGREVQRLEGHPEHVYSVAFSREGRRLASCGGNWNADKPGEVMLWDVVRGERLASSAEHAAPVWTLAWNPDDSQVASASGKWSGKAVAGEVRLWNVAGVKPGELPAATDDLLRSWWADLHGDDTRKADRAAWGLILARDKAVPLLVEKARAPKAIGSEQIARWVKDLDDDDCEVRDTASLGLENAGNLAREAVQAATKSPVPERRRRAMSILDRLMEVALSKEEIYALRELAVLTRLGPSARTVVERYLASPETTPVGGAARRALRVIDTP